MAISKCPMCGDDMASAESLVYGGRCENCWTGHLESVAYGWRPDCYHPVYRPAVASGTKLPDAIKPSQDYPPLLP